MTKQEKHLLASGYCINNGAKQKARPKGINLKVRGERKSQCEIVLDDDVYDDDGYYYIRWLMMMFISIYYMLDDDDDDVYYYIRWRLKLERDVGLY